MDKETAVVVFCATKKKISVDLEIPLFISANDLVIALNEAFGLKIDTSNIKNCYLKAERPIAFLRGNKSLKEFGVRNGTTIYFTE